MQLNRSSQITTLVALISVFILVLAACSNPATSTPNASGTLIAAPADKQVLRQPLIGGDFDTLDPALTRGNGDPLNILFTGLVGSKDDGTVIDQMAASHQVSPDGLTYTFKLKPNLKFSDGSPLTSQDVAYSINRTISPATKSDVSGYLSLVKDYDKASSGKLSTLIGDSLLVPDASTISIVISQPAAYFLEALAYPTSYVVEKKLIDQYGEKWTDHLQEGGGAGPYKVLSYSHTTGLDIVPDPFYYGPQPKLRKISYIITTDRDSTYKSFQAGQFDLAPVPPALAAIAKTKPGFHSTPGLVSRFIGMNYLSKPLDNIKIRQALDLAINKDLIINHIIGPSVTPSNHIVPKGIPGYDANLTGPADVISTAGDQTKAKALLKQGLLEDGYSDVSKLPSLTLSYALGYKAAADTLLAIADEWKQVLGINVKLVGLQGTELIKQEATTIGHSGPLQLWYGAWASDYPDPQDWLSLFFGKNSQRNTFNYGQNTSPAAPEQQAVQAELAKADAEQDFSIRKHLYNDAEQKIVNDAGWITTYQSSYTFSVNPKLQNWKLTPMSLLATDDWATIYFAQ